MTLFIYVQHVFLALKYECLSSKLCLSNYSKLKTIFNRCNNGATHVIFLKIHIYDFGNEIDT
jgi:hypothetical protein